MPEPLILLILLLLVPLAIIVWVAVRTYSSRFEALLTFLFASLLLALLYQWGQYPYVGSLYLRYLLPLLLTGAGMRLVMTVRDRPWYKNPGWRRGVTIGLLAIANLVLAAVVWTALRAHVVDKPAVDMQFPLRGGMYYISTGGSNGVLNLHYKPHTPSQMYAIDVDRLDEYGRYATGLVPDQLDDFLLYGDSVYSPCDGLVTEVEDGMPDNPPFEYDPESGSGNFVRIESESLRVALLHLARGSVLVQPGDSVTAGDPIGRVGNSGFSTQPHLHMQVSRAVGEDSTHVGVPVRFGGRFLVRNDVIEN